jgi:ribosomal protein L40E
MLASRSISLETSKARTALEKSCPFCCAEIPREAKKCRSCGEWVVSTSHGIAAMALRLFGLFWAVVSVAIAAGLWFAGQAIRGWVWMHSVNAQITPRVVDFVLYVVIAMVLLKGLAVGVGFGIMARLAPRRPRWWT